MTYTKTVGDFWQPEIVSNVKYFEFLLSKVLKVWVASLNRDDTAEMCDLTESRKQNQKKSIKQTNKWMYVESQAIVNSKNYIITIVFPVEVLKNFDFQTWKIKFLHLFQKWFFHFIFFWSKNILRRFIFHIHLLYFT